MSSGQKGKKLIKNIAYMFIGSFASKILSFLLVPLYTSVLSTEEYGVCDIIFTSILLLMPVFTLVIYEPMLRFSLEKDCDHTDVFMSGITVALVGFLVLAALSPLTLFVEAIRDYYWYCLAFYFVSTLHQCCSYFVRGIGRVKVYTIIGITNTGCMLGLNILFLLVLRIGIVGYILANILSHLVSIIVGSILAQFHRYIDFRRKPNLLTVKEMLRYSIPLIPNSVSWWVSNSSCRYVLTFFSGLAVNGVYSVANKIPSIISTMSTITNAAWQLSAVDDFGSGESKRFFARVYDCFLTLHILLVGVIILLTKQISFILFKADFYEAWKYVPLLTVAVMYNSMGGFIGTVFTSAKKTKALMTTTLVGAVANILLSIVLVPFIGGYGAAISTLFSYLVVYVARTIKSRSIMLFPRKTISNIASNILLLTEAIVIMKDFNKGIFYAAILFTLIAAVRIKSIMECFLLAKSIVRPEHR